MQEKTFALSRRALLRTAAVGAAATAATATIPSVVMAADGVAADTSKIRNFDMIEAFYREYPKKLAVVRGTLNRPLTLTEKILFTHLYHPESLREFKRGVDYIELRPDRAGTHDIGGPMAIIQFLSSGKERIALPAALVCDHLVQANVGAIPDLKVAEKGNVETYEFLRDVSRRYGFDFWPAGSGICHQVFMENYNFPGCMMLVTDSHTPTACGMGMLAIGMKADGTLGSDTLVVTVMSNLGLILAMREHGIRTVQTGVGDRYVLERMLQGGYTLGGEQSGHVIDTVHATTGDGVLTSLHVAARV